MHGYGLKEQPIKHTKSNSLSLLRQHQYAKQSSMNHLRLSIT